MDELLKSKIEENRLIEKKAGNIAAALDCYDFFNEYIIKQIEKEAAACIDTKATPQEIVVRTLATLQQRMKGGAE